MIVNQIRSYQRDKTVSAVYVNGVYFADSLEDVGRPAGVKIQDETCIPEGVYRVAITTSPRFKKPLMVLYNVEEDHSIERESVRYTGVRVHRGYTVEHTSGCVLIVGYETLQSLVQEELDSGEDVFWIINKMDIN